MAFNQAKNIHYLNKNKSPSLYRDKFFQLSSTFFFRLSLVRFQNHQKRFITTCFPWSLTVHVCVERCYIFFFLKKPNLFIHLIRQLHKGRNQNCVVCIIKEGGGWCILLNRLSSTTHEGQSHFSSDKYF